MAVVDRRVGAGPFSIVLDAVPRDLSSEAKRGWADVCWTADTLDLAGTLVSFDRSASWDPRPCWPSDTIRARLRWTEALQRCLARLSELVASKGGSGSVAGPRTPLAERTEHELAEALDRLTRNLRHGNDDAVARSAEELAGLGPGLTPAGDDVLVGALHALSLLGGRWIDMRPMLASVRERTTSLSGAWIEAAARGEAAEPWHTLVAAMNGDDQSAVTAAGEGVLAMGASSGRWALAGFVATIGALTEGDRA